MQQFVNQSPWDPVPVRRRITQRMVPLISPDAWAVDDVSFPKDGRMSVAVAHQYCGALGKQANCQVAVSLHAVTVLDDLGTHLAVIAGRPQNTRLPVLVTAVPPRQGHPEQPPARVADLREHHLGEPGGQPVVQTFGVGALAQLAAHLTGDLPDGKVAVHPLQQQVHRLQHGMYLRAHGQLRSVVRPRRPRPCCRALRSRASRGGLAVSTRAKRETTAGFRTRSSDSRGFHGPSALNYRYLAYGG